MACRRVLRAGEQHEHVDQRRHQDQRARDQHDRIATSVARPRRRLLDGQVRAAAGTGTGRPPSPIRIVATASREAIRATAVAARERAARSTRRPASRRQHHQRQRPPGQPVEQQRARRPRSTKMPPRPPPRRSTAAVPSARVRNWSARSSCALAPRVRRTGTPPPGRRSTSTASTPPSAEVGLSQLRDDVARRDARRHPAGGDAAGDRAEEERRDQRRQRERRAEERAAAQRRSTPCGRRTPRRAAMIPNAARVSGMYSVVTIAAKRRREAGPQHHQHEDQPDVVGLPHRPDGVLDQVALPRARAGCRRRAGPRTRRRSRRRRTARTRSARRTSTPSTRLGERSSTPAASRSTGPAGLASGVLRSTARARRRAASRRSTYTVSDRQHGVDDDDSVEADAEPRRRADRVGGAHGCRRRSTAGGRPRW